MNTRSLFPPFKKQDKRVRTATSVRVPWYECYYSTSTHGTILAVQVLLDCVLQVPTGTSSIILHCLTSSTVNACTRIRSSRQYSTSSTSTSTVFLGNFPELGVTLKTFTARSCSRTSTSWQTDFTFGPNRVVEVFRRDPVLLTYSRVNSA